MFRKLFLQLDLTSSQAEILSYLYQNQKAKASEIAKKIQRSRTIVYQEIEELVKLGVVEKKEAPNQVTVFSASHPSVLKQIIDKKEAQIKKNRELLNSYLPDILSSYALTHNRPGIKFYEGVDGLAQIYKEILNENKNFYLISSVHEPVYQEKILPIINDFIQKRVRKKIKIVAITPAEAIIDPKLDEKNLIKRIIVPKNVYNAPVEIDIFGNKVAILSFGKELIGIIIESQQIVESLTCLFRLSAFSLKNYKKISH